MSQKLALIMGDKDKEIYAPKHYVEGRTIEPIKIIEDVRLWRPYEIV